MPYADEQSADDTFAATRLFEDTARSSCETGQSNIAAVSNAECLQRACGYFHRKYGGSEAGNHYLRFGAVHAPIARNRDPIDTTELADTDADGPVYRFLLLLTTDVLVNADAGRDRLRQDLVENAVQRAQLVRSSSPLRIHRHRESYA